MTFFSNTNLFISIYFIYAMPGQITSSTPSTNIFFCLASLIYTSSWWFQPIWNICSSTWDHFPKVRGNEWNNIQYSAFRFALIWMFPKIVGFPPKSSIFNRVFHYFHHPFWGVLSLFLETPISASRAWNMTSTCFFPEASNTCPTPQG